LNILIKPLWIFGVDMGVQNLTGANEYGTYASLFSFSIILNILLDLGITNFNNKNIAQHSQLLVKYFSNMVVMKFLLGIVYAIICIGVGLLMGYDTHQFHLLYFLIGNQFILSFILYLRSNLSGLHYFKTDSFISITDRTLMLLICGGLLYFPATRQKFHIEWFVYSQTAAYLITFFIAFFIVLRHAKVFKFQFDYTFLVLIFKQSYPFALLVLLMSLYSRIDIVMIERMLPDGRTQAGIYSQAFRIIDAVSMFAFLFATLLLPIFARMIKQKESVTQLVRLSYLLLLVPTIVFSCVSVFYSKELIGLLYRQHVAEAASIYAILIIGYNAVSTSYIFGTLLTANNNVKQLNYMALIGVVTNIGLNIIFIPIYKAWGAAFSSLITQGITALIQALLAAKFFKFKILFSDIAKLFVFIFLVLFSCWATSQYIHHWMTGFLLVLGFGLIVAFLLKIINIKALVEIIRSEGD
jgi:O-antigen/teichoic acid export membrane protein